jgi:ferric-dicitrate binding protein FerR (iron transport regulator)
VDTQIFSAWIHDQLIFQDEPLSTVVKRLERWYNVNIQVADPSLMDLKLTANIEFESIREIMELMEITLPIRYAYNKDARKLTIYRKNK